MKVQDIVRKLMKSTAPKVVVRKNIRDEGLLATWVLRSGANEWGELDEYRDVTVNGIELGNNTITIYIKFAE